MAQYLPILYAILALGGLGILFGLVLGVVKALDDSVRSFAELGQGGVDLLDLVQAEAGPGQGGPGGLQCLKIDR